MAAWCSRLDTFNGQEMQHCWQHEVSVMQLLTLCRSAGRLLGGAAVLEGDDGADEHDRDGAGDERSGEGLGARAFFL